MKKTVIIILAILPIFLVVTISFAGRILSLYQHISVDRVEFVDEDNKKYEDDYIFVVNVGETKSTQVRIYPDLATDKKVSYFANNTDICTVDGEGNVTGVAFGMSQIIVKTDDGNKIAILLVQVKQDRVTSISLPYSEIELNIGEVKILTASVQPYVAENKKVYYSSSNNEVAKVDANGKVTAVGEGEAIITAVSEDGGHIATCTVICKSGIAALGFDFSDNNDFIQTENGYITSVRKIYLLNHLQFDEKKVNIEDVKFRIKSGDKKAILNGDELTITGSGLLTIVAYVGDQDNPQHQAELRLMIE